MSTSTGSSSRPRRRQVVTCCAFLTPSSQPLEGILLADDEPLPAWLLEKPAVEARTENAARAEQIRQRVLHWLHITKKRSEAHYATARYYFMWHQVLGMVTMVISAIVSSLLFSSGRSVSPNAATSTVTAPTTNTTSISTANDSGVGISLSLDRTTLVSAVLSMSSGLLTGIATFSRFGEAGEKHKQAGIEYVKLRRELQHQLIQQQQQQHQQQQQQDGNNNNNGNGNVVVPLISEQDYQRWVDRLGQIQATVPMYLDRFDVSSDNDNDSQTILPQVPTNGNKSLHKSNNHPTTLPPGSADVMEAHPTTNVSPSAVPNNQGVPEERMDL